MPERIKVVVIKDMMERIRRETKITLELAAYELKGGIMHPTTVRKLRLLDEATKS